MDRAEGADPGLVVERRVVRGARTGPWDALARRLDAVSARSLELPGLVALLLLGAALRLPGLATRGTWDGDQGHDMLVLRAFVRDGQVPLLGPPTSIGDVHHGALYYYLLAPAAALTGGDSPLAVVALIALGNLAAIAVTWWLARSMGGPAAGFVAALLMAVSIAAIDEATFIWNPNLIPLSSSLALAGAWRAWSTGRSRWWLLAAAGTAVTMQLHVLGAVFLPVVAALFVADARRRRGSDRRGLYRVGLAGLGIVALGYVPLAVHELTTGFAELRAALAWFGEVREPAPFDPLTRFLIVGLRVVSWPLVGLIADAFVPAVAATTVLALVVAWRWRSPRAAERTAVRWLGPGLLWASVALTVGASSLAVVIRALPNDHYHAFADPMVLALAGVGAAAAWRVPRRRPLAAAGVALVVAWNVLHLPPTVHPDGGFPAARAAAERIGRWTGERPTALRALPDFTSTAAYAYPLARDGRRIVEAGEASALVVVCHDLFVEALGAPCGGPAEDRAVGPSGRFAELVDRWEAAPGRVVSVYLAPEAAAD